MSSTRHALRGALLCVALLVLLMVIPRYPQPVRERPSIDRLFRPGRSQEPFVDVESVPWTTYDGGIEGYTVWSNLYLSGGTLVAFSKTKEAADSLPNARGILTDFDGVERLPAGPDLWATIAGADLAHDRFGEGAVRLPGVTYLFNDPPGESNLVASHYHFIVDLLVPAARAVASTRTAAGLPLAGPVRVIFPRCGADPSWRDERGMNSWLLRTMFPNIVVEDKLTWDDWARGDVSYVFEQVVIVDRSAAHSASGDVARWGRMNANVPHMDAPRGFWDPFSTAIATAVGDLLRVGRFNLPVVVYFDRSAEPLINPSSNDALITGLRELTGRSEVHIARIQGMTRRQKVALVSRANIVVGLNAEDMLQIMFMQAGKGNAVVELFETDGFSFDYALLAHMLGLKHIAIQGSRELTPQMWDEHPNGKRGPQHEDVIDIDASAVLHAVVRLLDELEGQAGRKLLLG
ncbi:hypothetical protein CcaverHIS002_0304140 [Cutaneotrichosporon cavernicola]|uniref:Uncharacterized protein n=1 Tax=Cutaneotrichosporon cavernicola TaxID=279322 RepID=A0AA48I3B0_9TREE|nr:uncharacterized protein CcaverHIS019_0304110 [Cutaneotrichosporon cavernicola]BEI82546.1 hypothetical protein CcaverHIS002_0304140 [Cutaneotrichosporon cavernicola]BEI90341.1 hypothetical protein CcaverHIS019_0304110 [Cutaneotrichosporon cavernicola]BEI98117.1 hypothetical protein CcaverHIS631_0304160 [Cutaneotrichosporon cavernicola]BEJ05894.1 hypothetical protein CcaverHIS641_0304160 [Cutaneotrichosporon cavernicola]